MSNDDATIDRVEQYTFEPIKGYPMLQWHGKRPFTSTQYYPAQHKETYGPEVQGWRNKLYWGDNLQVMSHLLRQYRGKVQLVYIDPPFDSKADYKKKIVLRGQRVEGNLSAFEEKQYSDIWTNDEYLQFMYERFVLIRELLSPTGALYLHCDYHNGHYLKIICDEIFGRKAFSSEIIWKRTTGHFDAQHYGSVHDSIIFYAKSQQHTLNIIYQPYDQEYIEQYYRYKDEDGRVFMSGDLTGAGGGPPRIFGNKGSITPPAGRHWMYDQSGIDKALQEGRIYWTRNGIPRLKKFLDDSPGMPASDIWDDIQPIRSWHVEAINYPTQKPERLIERIIQASSNPGDLVFDCFMGSCTTQAVAMKLGRRFIGADINLGAVQTTTKRLISLGSRLQQPQGKLNLDSDSDAPSTLYTGFEVYNVNNYDIFRNPVEAKELLLQALEVNRLQAGSLFDGEKDGRLVKIMPVNRITTRQDLNELITGFDYRAFERRQAERPTQPVERITLVCMGHEPGLAAHLQREVPYRLDIEVVDILRDKQEIQFKRDAEAKMTVQGDQLVIERFYPMNLLAKLSLQQEHVGDWRELVESVLIDWNYDGAVLQPTLIDAPEGDELVVGRYAIPADAGTIRVKITDLLSESLEQEVRHG